MAERLVNSSERRNPPNSSTPKIRTCGVVGLKSANAISVREANSPLTISSRRKPDLNRNAARKRLDHQSADGPGEGGETRAQGIETKAQLQHQRQQEGAGADAETEKGAAEDARLEGAKAHQAQIEQRSFRAQRMAHVARQHHGPDQHAASRHFNGRDVPARHGRPKITPPRPRALSTKPVTSSGAVSCLMSGT